jgi:hypothetical protein
MASYPMLEENGFCVSVTARKGHEGYGRRWQAWIQFERGGEFARLHIHESAPIRVPNDYPDEAQAVQAAYDHARSAIARELAHQQAA